HHWDGQDIVMDATNDETYARYLRGLGLIARETDDGQNHYFHNMRGDVVQHVDDNAPSTYEYNAFGNEMDPTPGDQNPFRYCGEYWDAETQAYYLRARYYNPQVGRFNQPDPHWNTRNMQGSNEAILQSGNLYVYTMNNPVKWADPNGEFAILAPIIAGAIAVSNAINTVQAIQDTAWNPVTSGWGLGASDSSGSSGGSSGSSGWYSDSSGWAPDPVITPIRQAIQSLTSRGSSPLQNHRQILSLDPYNLTDANRAAGISYGVRPDGTRYLRQQGIAHTPIRDSINQGVWLATSIKGYGFVNRLFTNAPSAAQKQAPARTAPRVTRTSNQGNVYNDTPSRDHSVTSNRNNSLHGRPNSSVDYIDNRGEVITRRWFGPDGKQVRDIHYTNHGNPLRHPEWPHHQGLLP
ncbi:MAG: RHS repeat-associated core domain-containing protein, partial [Defluviitaleaceae bacterium]|nr:RHS repeat-associated core domain-containing protein [Defluviitaleaceae bacterium]